MKFVEDKHLTVLNDEWITRIDANDHRYDSEIEVTISMKKPRKKPLGSRERLKQQLQAFCLQSSTPAVRRTASISNRPQFNLRKHICTDFTVNVENKGIKINEHEDIDFAAESLANTTLKKA